MLIELRVRNLGVVEDLSLVFGEGMTAVTGETGAGKTMVVEAIRLLTGGRAESHVVRSGAEEAWVEGRFELGDEEIVLSRVIPAEGRSRAYVNGQMAAVSSLVDAGARLVGLHGQHAQQSLFSGAEQRRGLDVFAGVDLEDLHETRRAIANIDADLAKLGGDVQARAREVDLLRFQLEELDVAGLGAHDEDEVLLREEELLADASAHREAAAVVHDALAGDGGASEQLARAIKAAGDRAPLAPLAARMATVQSEVDDLSLDAGAAVESLQDDPVRLAAVQERRAQLKALMRKYGSTLDEVLAYRDETRARVSELERHDEVVAQLEADRAKAERKLRQMERKVRAQRAEAAPRLAGAVQVRLRDLALPHARFEITVGDSGAGDDVTFLLGPNPGMPALPIAKAASGGELARSMLALRLALLDAGHRDADAPPCLVFDEIDAGIGGEAAIAVGKALAEMTKGPNRAQVFAVTHLAQVAAFAHQQVSVDKRQEAHRTVARIRTLGTEDREIELARMLSGRPDSRSGRAHARELLSQAEEANGARPA
jgi:DNA repair protein RecN (Recombination protein N)